jgi:hypothetical protein
MSRLLRFFWVMVAGIALALLVQNPAAGQTSHPDVAAPKGGVLDYQNESVGAMIDILGQLSGKQYVLDAELAGLPPISVNITGLGKDAGIKLITATLLLNGVALIPVDDQTMKVVTTGTNKNPRSEGLRIYTAAADLPNDDEIVTYYMSLDHIDPQEAAGIFIQVAPVHLYGAYVPAPSAQGVILTENASVIRELIELKKSIDVTRPRNVPLPPPHPDHPGPPPAGMPPPHPRHPLVVILVFLLAAAVSYYIGLRRGRSSSPR